MFYRLTVTTCRSIDHFRSFVFAPFETLLSFIFSLSFELAHHFWRAVLHQLAALIQTAPLGQSVWNVHDALAIEHVQARLEIGLVFVRLEMNEAGK